MILSNAQVTIPSTRGNKNETALHLTLFVSLYIVSIVVEHGKWNIEKAQAQIAVVTVQPLSTKIIRILSADEKSTSPFEQR